MREQGRVRGLLVGDIFSGIGCASWAFRRAGFSPVFAVDTDPERCLIYERNLGLRPQVADVRRVSGVEILSSMGLKKGELDVLVGCPPCQSFSTLSRTRGINTQQDERSMLVEEFARLVEEILPRAVLLENVLGLAKRGAYIFSRYLERLRLSGYETVHDVLDAADYGVPQRRKRVFAISIRKREGKTPSLPAPTHFEKERYPRWRTVRSAIGDLPRLEAGERDRRDPFHCASSCSPKTLKIIRMIPRDGGGRRALPPELVLPCHAELGKGADNVYGRMWWDRPGPTMTTVCIRPSCGRFVHPEQDRPITHREAARLQSIPDEFYLGESPERRRDSLAAMLGDAVPPDMITPTAFRIASLLT